jgi:hypothetical protein
MKVMGHQDFKTALRYQHPELDIVRAALNGTQGGIAPEASTIAFSLKPVMPCRASSQISALRTEVSETRVESGLSTHVLL